MSKNKYWIQDAIKHPGALRKWLQRNRKKIKRATGMDPFTKTGEINTLCLIKLRKTKLWDRLKTVTKRRIILAITLEKLHPDNKHKKHRRKSKRKHKK